MGLKNWRLWFLLGWFAGGFVRGWVDRRALERARANHPMAAWQEELKSPVEMWATAPSGRRYFLFGRHR